MGAQSQTSWSVKTVLAVTLGLVAIAGGGYLATNIKQLGAAPTTADATADVTISATATTQTPLMLQAKAAQMGQAERTRDDRGIGQGS